MPPIHVHFLPELTPPTAIVGSCCVVIDVLRATTTILEALAAKATGVVPCLTVEDAVERANRETPRAILGGERGGKPIPGFDLGNSPSEYSANRIAGKLVVFTTTNGTKAMLQCHGAREIMLAALVNLSAMTRYLQQAQTEVPINIVCAGTAGSITREDVLLAGALVSGLNPADDLLNDQALIARDGWREAVDRGDVASRKERVITALRASRGGRNLVGIGLADDIPRAADIDRHDLLAEYRPERGLIELVEAPRA